MKSKEHSERGENPKRAFGRRKSCTSTTPQQVMHMVGVALTEGAMKYGAFNYRETPIDMADYYDAARLHLDSWWEGEDFDPDSGIHHVVKGIATLVVLMDAIMNDMAEDTRPPKVKSGWMSQMNTMITEIRDRPTQIPIQSRHQSSDGPSNRF